MKNCVREEKNFNIGWLYASVDLENGYQADLCEDGFVSVCLPRANKWLDSYKGEDFQRQIDSYRFVSWYRRHFALDSTYGDKKIYVAFQGVATVADVYVNGEYVGNHKGAYTGFTFDITEYIKTDGNDNVIAVRVDSTRQAEVPPEGGDVDYCHNAGDCPGKCQGTYQGSGGKRHGNGRGYGCGNRYKGYGRRRHGGWHR